MYNISVIIYKKRNGGTAGTISNNAVTLELSRTSTKSENHILNILWHELTHLYFRNNKFYPLLKEYTNSNWEIMGKIDELVASALLPNGLLKSHVLSDIDESVSSDIFNARISSNNILNIQKLIYPYLQQKRTIDIELVQKLFAIY